MEDPFAKIGPMPTEPAPKASATGSTLPWFTASTLAGQDVPERLWLVPDLVPAGDITLLGGDGGTGKSLLALQLACSVAMAKPWIGRATSSGRAMFVSAEDDEAEIHRRLHAITSAEGADIGDLTALTILSLAGKGAILAAPQPRGNLLSPTPLFSEFERRVAEEMPTLLVLDTLSDLWSGDENNRAQARQFVGLLRSISMKHGCAVLLLAHPSLTGLANGSGLSGSTAWNNSVRSRITLERITQDGHEADPDRRKLVVRKANYTARGGEIVMRWKAGAFEVEGGDDALDHRAASARAHRVFMALLRLHAEQGRRVNAAGGPSYAPTVFEQHPKGEGITRRAFKVAMEELLSIGRIEVVEDGPPSKRRTYLAEVG